MTALDWNSALSGWLEGEEGEQEGEEEKKEQEEEAPVGFMHASTTLCLRLVLSAPPSAGGPSEPPPFGWLELADVYGPLRTALKDKRLTCRCGAAPPAPSRSLSQGDVHWAACWPLVFVCTVAGSDSNTFIQSTKGSEING